jgi:hypothetical protein
METQEILKKLDENLKKLEERDQKQTELIRVLSENVNKLNIIISGDSSMGVYGLVRRVEDTEKAISGLNKIIDNAKAIKWAFGMLVFGGFSIFSSIIYFLFKISEHISIK